MPIFMKALLTHLVQICLHFLDRTVRKTDEKCRKYGQNFCCS
jgi:hypothetical protein